MSKTAIVFGATGLIGKAVVEGLINSSHFDKIVTYTRVKTDHISPKVHNQVINFDNLDELKPHLIADCLFSCLGTTKSQAGSTEKQRIVDVEYQLKIAQFAAQNHITHYLLFSSTGANNNSKSAYLKMKGELEAAIIQFSFNTISIFRPSVLVGKRNEFRLGEGIAKYILPIICLLPGLQKYRPIHGEQVANKMVNVAESSNNSIKYYNLDELFID